MKTYTMNNEKKAIKEIEFEDLDTVSGGGLFDELWDAICDGTGTVIKDIYDSIFGSNGSSAVEGPKTGLTRCNFCGQAVHEHDMKDHIMNYHKDDLSDLIAHSEIF